MDVPPNVYFIVDDATEEDWLWNENHFDFIQSSNLIGSLPSMKELAKKAFKYLKPGGYFECHELDSEMKCEDGTLPPENPDGFSDYALRDWIEMLVNSGLQADPPRQIRIARYLGRWMVEVGFVDVKVQKFKVPVSAWPQDKNLQSIGRMMERNWYEGVSGWSYKPFTDLGWSKAEIEVFLVNVRQSIQNHDVHAYNEFYVVTGKKPFPKE